MIYINSDYKTEYEKGKEKRKDRSTTFTEDCISVQRDDMATINI